MAFARSLNFMDHAEWPQFILLNQIAGSSFHKKNDSAVLPVVNILIVRS